MNPLAQMMGRASSMTGGIDPQAIQSVKRMVGMLQAAKNPQAALQMVAQQNPAFGSVMQMCNGKSPKAVFEEQCKSHGLNPQETIKQIEAMMKN